MSGAVEWWSCRTCGPHPSSTAGWCDLGCGSDFNRMDLLALGPWQVIGALAKVKHQNDRYGRWFQPWPPRALAHLATEEGNLWDASA